MNNFENVVVPGLVQATVQDALWTVDYQYGTGYPNFRGGRNGGRAYHNGYHSRAVIADFDRLASELELGKYEYAVGIAACAAHDLILGYGRGEDEAASALWLTEALRPNADLPRRYLTMGKLAVHGTEPIFENGLMVGQKASVMEYPDQEHELIAKIVASADLGRLYAPDGPLQAHLLLKEIHNIAPGDQIDFAKVLDFQRGQVPFLEGYNYPLAEAASILAVNKAKVINYVGRLVSDIEAGRIDSWDALIAKDVEFMRQS